MTTEMTYGNELYSFHRHLYMVFELGQQEWKLGFTIGFGQKPRLRTIPARDLKALQDEMRAAKKRFGLAEDTPVLSCYEAGRDGFWLHRYLTEHGIENLIVDSSSIEVNRKAKRAKTDRLDARKLLTMLMRYAQTSQAAPHCAAFALSVQRSLGVPLNPAPLGCPS